MKPEPGRIAVQRGRDQAGWIRWLPGLQTLRSYQAAWLHRDIVAGLVLTTMLVPVGIAYAVASGIPGIHGLYATIVPLLAYALFGPSRILVLGPDSSLAAVILAVVLPLSGGDSARAVVLAGTMAIVSGIICILAGLARLGFITELLSKPIRYGYMNGIALTVLISQLPRIFGFSIQSEGPVANLLAIVTALLEGRANQTAFLIGAGTLMVILLLKGNTRVPGILVAVVGATVVVGALDLATRAGVSVLGSLPHGLPAFAVPWITSADLGPVLIGGLTVAVVSFADTSVLSRSYAARTRTYVDPNQEMIGLGAANLAAGFFQGFPISSSSSRTPVAEAAGARTQVTGVIGALSVALLLMVAPDLLRHLPSSALAAVVIASAIGLIEITDLRRIFRIQQWEFWLSIGCTVGVAVLGAIPGIGLAVVIAVIEFLWDGWRPHSAVLGRADGVKGYHDITRYPNARLIPGLVLFRWDAPLFFANAELFRDRALEAVAASPTPVSWLIVAAEPVTSLDVTAADVVAELDETLNEAGIELCFAEVKDPVKDKLRRFGLGARLGEESLFPTLGAAVGRYLDTHQVDWVDWEDRVPDRRACRISDTATGVIVPATPPFRADHVGSLLRPERVHEARVRYRADRLGPDGFHTCDELRAIEDEAIRDAVRMQESVGLKAVTDGEYRRSFWHYDFMGALSGLQLEERDAGVQFHGLTLRPIFPTITGKIDFPDDHPMLGHFRYLASIATVLPKISIPGPSASHFRTAPADVHPAEYADLDVLFADIAQAYRKAVHAFYEAGCRYLQMDDIFFAYLCDPKHRAEKMAQGVDPDWLIGQYAKMMHDAIDGRPDDLVVAMHMCRGNYKSTWAADGAYDPAADAVFNQTGVDIYFMEYDTERAGSLQPLRLLPKGDQRVMLGFITTKTPELESLDDLRRRFDEASRYADLDQLGIAPQCGFASTEEGNALTPDQQVRKLELVVRTAEAIWGGVEG